MMYDGIDHDEECEKYSERCGCESRARLREQIELLKKEIEDIRVAEIQERLDKTTSGPWIVSYREEYGKRRVYKISTEEGLNEDHCYEKDQGVIVETDGGYYPPRENDAEFIAHARSDVPWLLETVRYMSRLIEGMKEK